MFQYGIKGIAFALLVYSLSYQICIQITIRFIISELNEVSFFPTKESFDNLGDWCRLATPGIFMCFFYGAGFEVFLIASGLIS